MIVNEKNIKDYLINSCYHDENYCEQITDIRIKDNKIHYLRKFYNVEQGWYESAFAYISLKFFYEYVFKVRQNKINKIKECLK